jgi:hypothetical protein
MLFIFQMKNPTYIFSLSSKEKWHTIFIMAVKFSISHMLHFPEFMNSDSDAETKMSHSPNKTTEPTLSTTASRSHKQVHFKNAVG